MRKTAMLLALVLIGACVTVNIYFPAAEIKKDAAKVVDDVYGIDGEKEEQKQGSSLDFPSLFGPKAAHAQDYVNLTNSVTRGIRQQLKSNQSQLGPYFNSGVVGIDRNGFAAVRDAGGLGMKDMSMVKKLVNNDANLKRQLYQAKAEAANTPNEAGKVQAIYADEWRNKAHGGWWIQDNGGNWQQK